MSKGTLRASSTGLQNAMVLVVEEEGGHEHQLVILVGCDSKSLRTTEVEAG